MTVAPDLLAHDWLGACRRAADGLRDVLERHPTSADRCVETGDRGGGGDLTLVIDAEAEDVVFAELERLHVQGADFTVVAEERGFVDLGAGGGPPFVVVDPIDGSLNAKRGLPHHALSIAVADGPTMADVAFGYVYDLGPSEEWHAVRGGGAFLDGVALDPSPERRGRDGKLEVVAVESADPRWLRGVLGGPVRRHGPGAGARDDRGQPVPARRRPRRRDGDALEVPRASTPPRPSSSCARAAASSPSPRSTTTSPRPWTSSRTPPWSPPARRPRWTSCGPSRRHEPRLAPGRARRRGRGRVQRGGHEPCRATSSPSAARPRTRSRT